MPFYKLWGSYKPTGDSTTYVGRDGELIVDPTTDSLRMMDGVTPGGQPISGGASSLDSLTDVQVSEILAGQVLQWNGTSWAGATVAGTFDGQYSSLAGAPTNVSAFTNDAGYLTSYTETDPVFTAWDKSTGISITESQISDFGTYLTSYTETDPVFTASVAAGITQANIDAWNAASIGAESDPVFTASPAGSITNTQVTNWDTAFGWGDHSAAGYLTSFTETDPIFTASAASGITATQVTNWDTAFSWGDHSNANYIATDTSPQLTDLTITGNLFVSGTTNTVDATVIQGSLTLEQVNEPIQTVAVATAGPITFDTIEGQLFYVNLPATNWTANITNLSATTNQGTNLAIVVQQGATAYLPTALQIGGTAVTINWQGGAAPLGTNNGIDVVNVSVLNLGGTYTVLGQMVDF